MARLKLLGAVGVRQIMLELGPRFEHATGHDVVSEFDSSGLIVRRVEGGEDLDLVMINRLGIDCLVRAGRVVASSATDLARSVAAAAVRKGAPRPDMSTVKSFKSALLAARSIARPSPAVGGSSGDHIVQVLQRLGIADHVDAKSVVNEDLEDMWATPGYLVASGRAELALHQLQELMVVPGIDIVGPFPSELQGTFTFSAGRSTATREVKAAGLLVEFLRTPDATAVIAAMGMEPAPFQGSRGETPRRGGRSRRGPARRSEAGRDPAARQRR